MLRSWQDAGIYAQQSYSICNALISALCPLTSGTREVALYEALGGIREGFSGVRRKRGTCPTRLRLSMAGVEREMRGFLVVVTLLFTL